MIGYLENFLYNRIKRGEVPRDIIQDMLDKNMIKSPKQAWATLFKWARKDLYEWGCVCDLGWTTKKKRIPRGN